MPLTLIWFTTILVARKLFIMTKVKQNYFNISVIPLFHFLKFLSHGNHSHRALGKTENQVKFILSILSFFSYPSTSPGTQNRPNCTSLSLCVPQKQKKSTQGRGELELKLNLRLLREKLVLNRIIQFHKNIEYQQPIPAILLIK